VLDGLWHAARTVHASGQEVSLMARTHRSFVPPLVVLCCALGGNAYAQSTERLKTEPTASPAAPTAVSPERAAKPDGDPDHATASILDRGGKRVGLVTLTAVPGGTVVNAEFTGLPAGVHGFHVHAVGKCEPPFDSAGPHWNPTGVPHGVAVGPGHVGDLPNLFMAENGRVHVEVFAHGLALGKGPGGVFDGDGAALVVHAAADDYRTDPSGSSGDRIACGVIER
jgi:Cu-Zn family superoxide dismutase